MLAFLILQNICLLISTFYYVFASPRLYHVYAKAPTQFVRRHFLITSSIIFHQENALLLILNPRNGSQDGAGLH